MYVALELGGAYAVNDLFSFSLGARYLMARNRTQVDLTLVDSMTGTFPDTAIGLDVEDTANGFGGIIGFDLVPVSGLTIGFRYESKVELDFKTDQKQDDFGLTVDGEKHRRDFPAMAGMGIGYSLTPAWTIEADFSWYFQKQADWGKSDSGDSYATLAGDCVSYGATTAYAVTPRFQLSAGLLYTDFLFKDIDAYYTNLGSFEVGISDNLNLAVGCAVELSEAMKLNLAAGYTLWDDETITVPETGIMVTTQNTSYAFALGLNFRI
jgi:long-chain fatty acid transport protein